MSPFDLFRKKPRSEPRPTLTLRSRTPSCSMEEAERMGAFVEDALDLDDAREALDRSEVPRHG